MRRATAAPQRTQPPAGSSPNPYVFIVGAPRSGTRLLGRLVNAHPEIAVINEARFVPGWFRHRRGVTPEGFVTPEMVEKLAQFERFEHLEVERGQLEQLVAGREKMPYSAFVTDAFAEIGANARGHAAEMRALFNDHTRNHDARLPRRW